MLNYLPYHRTLKAYGAVKQLHFEGSATMKRLLSSLLAIVMLFALLATEVPYETTAAGTQPSSYSDQSNSGTRDVTCTTLSGTGATSYYTGSNVYDTLSEQSANAILQALRTLMTSTHKYNSSYANCRDYANRTDCQNGNSNTIVTLYTSYVTSQSQYNGGSGWNREHVWPKSLGGFETSGPGADLHHIRPSENRTNSNRGNLKYGNVSGGKSSTGNLSGLVGGQYSSYFEPLDNVKGDVARICLYVYVRYGGSYSKCSSITNVFQSVDVLLQWMELDPVDTWEMGRNEVIESIQGNRNVFIDYPEYAWLIFGREVPNSMTTPSGEAKGSNGSGSTTPTPCQHTSTEVRGWKGATCQTTGYTGDTYCKSCGVKIATGSTTPLADHKDSNNDYKCDTCSTRLNCDHVRKEERNKKSVTCTENGYTGDTYCLDCGDKLTTGTVITATGHKDLDGNGECDACGNRSDCKHAHVEIRNRVSADCTTAGYTGDQYCIDCQTIIANGKTFPEVHIDGDRNFVCDACGATITPPATEPTEAPTKPTVPAEPSAPTDNSPAGQNNNQPIIWIVVGIIAATIILAIVIIVVKKAKNE